MIQKREPPTKSRKARPIAGKRKGRGAKVHLANGAKEKARQLEVIALLEDWLKDESGYDEETWPKLKASLDLERKRNGQRRLFDAS